MNIQILPIFLLLLLSFSGFTYAKGKNEQVLTLPQLGQLLKTAESVEIHKQLPEQLLVSWASEDGRKLSEKTLRVLERIVEVSQKTKNLNIYVSVSAVDVEDTPGLAQLNSEYKATYIRRALVQQCATDCQAYVAGVGSAMNMNKVFVAIVEGENPQPALIAFK